MSSDRIRGRDPAPIAATIRRIQAKTHDMRVGQIIENAIGRKSLFYIEDDDLLAALAAYEKECSR